MKYGSVCSGIEAASVAWRSLPWEPQWFSEIDPFCNRVLEHHWPTVPNLGDLTKLRKDEKFKSLYVDLLVGGTPCQAFSLAGDREGLDDERGDLTLEYIKCIKAKQPKWFIWENVPGVLHLAEQGDGGRKIREGYKGDEVFGSIIAEMAKCGYGIAYRVLDAKDFGCAQARPRVFVVGHSSGDWRIPARVLGIEPTRDYDSQGSNNEAGRIPTLRLRNAGGKNARGVGIIEEINSRGESSRPSEETKKQVLACTKSWEKELKKKGEKFQEFDTTRWRLRRFTPAEEERRQGFSGIHTAIDGAEDSERYEAIGNSMAVPVMQWLGEQIQKEEENTMAGKHTTDAERVSIKQDLDSGLSEQDVAKKYSRSLGTIHKIALGPLAEPKDASPQNERKEKEGVYPAWMREAAQKRREQLQSELASLEEYL